MYLCEVCGEYRYYSCHKVELLQQRLCDHLQGEGIIIVFGLRSSQLLQDTNSITIIYRQ